jgi:hypothetical protein
VQIPRDAVHLVGTPASRAEELTALKGEVVTESLSTMRVVDPTVVIFNEEEKHRTPFYEERRKGEETRRGDDGGKGQDTLSLTHEHGDAK